VWLRSLVVIPLPSVAPAVTNNNNNNNNHHKNIIPVSAFLPTTTQPHSRGGQSALRFARLRLEKRKNYIRKVAELAAQLLIDPATNLPNVAGIVCAGNADFKQKLQNDLNFDPRLKKAVIKTVDVSYGGDNGFSQAIEQVRRRRAVCCALSWASVLHTLLSRVLGGAARGCLLLPFDLAAHVHVYCHNGCSSYPNVAVTGAASPRCRRWCCRLLKYRLHGQHTTRPPTSRPMRCTTSSTSRRRRLCRSSSSSSPRRPAPTATEWKTLWCA
jgi:hypothetical protein